MKKSHQYLTSKKYPNALCVQSIFVHMCVNIQMKRKELTRRDDEDGDSMLSSTLSDGGSTKRKRYIYSISETTGFGAYYSLKHSRYARVTVDSCLNVLPLAAIRRTQRRTA